MRVLSMVLLSSFLVSCDWVYAPRNQDDCNDPDLIMWEPKTYEFYSELKTGLSCDEITELRTRPSYGGGCAVTVQAEGDASQADGSPEASNSEDNVEHAGVVEPRKYIHYGELTYYLHQGFLFISDLNGNQISSEQIFENIGGADQLIRHNDLLIIGNSSWNHSEYKYFLIDKKGELVLKEEKEFNGRVNLRKVKNQLHLYVTENEVPEGVACEDIRFVSNSNYGNFTTIYKQNLSDDEFSLTGEGSYYGYLNIHTLKDELILTDYLWSEGTALIKHDSEEPKMTTVNGRIPSYFAIQEKDDHLAVFYSRKNYNDNALGVFDKEMNLVNELGFMGVNERIFSSRFVGDLAYVVTFRNIDPLYTIDISDIRYPKLLSELKIPGVSRYLHQMTEDYLIGVGDTTGGWWDNQTEINLFDTSDLEDVKKVDSVILPNNNRNFFRHHQDMLKYNDFFMVKQFDILYVFKLKNGKLETEEKIENLHSKSEYFVIGGVLYVLGPYNTVMLDLYEETDLD